MCSNFVKPTEKATEGYRQCRRPRPGWGWGPGGGAPLLLPAEPSGSRSTPEGSATAGACSTLEGSAEEASRLCRELGELEAATHPDSDDLGTLQALRALKQKKLARLQALLEAAASGQDGVLGRTP